MPKIKLEGCKPEPLMSYLKALGVFRLIAEQADSDARLAWRGGVAVLDSMLDHDGITSFFLETYQPTPIIVPWSGGDFFGVDRRGNAGPYKKTPTSTRIIEAMLATSSQRLETYRDTICFALQAMDDCNVHAKSDIEGTSNKHIKSKLISTLRNRLPDQIISWIDATSQQADIASVFNPLLGSGGGSDGNAHFSDNFMQNLWDCLPDFDSQRTTDVAIKPDIRNALFNDLQGSLVERTGALYDSGAVGGPNATQGFERRFLVNSWNFILAMEGLLIFAGGLSKKYGTNNLATPSFPYIIRMSAAGSDFGSAVLAEYGQYEVWIPLWRRFANFSELLHLFREARAQIGRRQAHTGIDMARAVATQGVCSGIEEYLRYGLIRGRVGGKNYFTAVAVGPYHVRYDTTVSLIEQLNSWLEKGNLIVRDDKSPKSYKLQFQELDRAIADFCRINQSKRSIGSLHNILEELGHTEQMLAKNISFCEQKKYRIRPIQRLTSRWLKQADDGSPEFRLAASLVGIRSCGKVGPFRTFLEEVKATKYVDWSPGSTSAVWSKRPLAANLAAVFRRRQLEAFRDGLAGVPLDSTRWASLSDVVLFLNEETDDDKLQNLIWGLLGVEQDYQPATQNKDDAAVPFEFGVPRLLVKERCLVAKKGFWHLAKAADANKNNVKPDPDVFHLFASSRPNAIRQCVDRAARRLKSGGLLVNGYRNRRSAGKSLAVVSRIEPERLLASMLFPLSTYDLETIANSVLYPPETQE